MARLYNDPASFAEDMTAGFVAANGEHVRQVPGGVVRSHPGRRGKVSVVTGGGSGHYPTFCGVVGPGFADGSVIGNIFTAPSAEDAYSVGSAADHGGGVIFSFGNYAGDNMNFGMAAERLRRDGVRADNLVITDDIASASVGEESHRRGVVGNFVVFKIASAAAEEGYAFDEVMRVGQHANARTRSLGVAFDGCTLPGQDAPLFEVPHGRMGLGLGIHGEPGVSETDMPSAAELAEMLVNGVLAEAPERTENGSRPRVTAILNGLGATKYEELFVVWRTVARLLDEAGVQVVSPEVGELVTSLDMAGCSLTLTWLDEELERLWDAPVHTPAYRKGTVSPAPAAEVEAGAEAADAHTTAVTEPEPDELVTEMGRRTAEFAARALRGVATELDEAAEQLGELDSIAGDGDHGRGMARGSAAAAEAAERSVADGAGPRAVLIAAGDAWSSKAGGTSGALWGAALAAFGDRVPGDRATTAEDVLGAAAAAADAVRRLGRAEPGDKTMLDALIPFADALHTRSEMNAAISVTWSRAAEVATRAAANTAELRPQTGRARPLAERSIGTPDPGATSLAMVVTRVGALLTEVVAEK